MREPTLDSNGGGKGLQGDYHQCEGAFGDDSEASKTDINEYLADLKSYENRHFDYDDTKEVYDLLCSWMDNALKKWIVFTALAYLMDSIHIIIITRYPIKAMTDRGL